MAPDFLYADRMADEISASELPNLVLGTAQ